MTMRFIPHTQKLVAKASDGKLYIMNPELLTDLDSRLGNAAREAVQHPNIAISVETPEEGH